MEKFYSSYRFPQYFGIEEQAPVDRLPYQYRPAYQNSGYSGNSGLPYWEQYRQLVTKRQSRYRQCYFNPISCFRK